ncbi:MAG: pirin family protein [Gammaproteobacteria bacterium]|nr:pirin family protein [Gammaproteobacteria bacterium]
MKIQFHPSTDRGVAKMAWLDSKFSFSFAHWYDPQKIHFGALRVLNDDIIAPRMGFGMHPHDNMEIVTIMLSGELQHKDSMGCTKIIKAGEVQHMTAGLGIRHSEVNSSSTDESKLLQLWVLPRVRNLKPSYDQRYFDASGRDSQWQFLATPQGGNSIKVEQDAYFVRRVLKPKEWASYALNGEHQGVYVFVIEGSVEIHGHVLGRRDAIGLWELDQIGIKASENADVLLVEIPMVQPSFING